MVAFTTPDGFPIETAADRPLVTLSGGPTGGESPLLAEVVQAKVSTFDASIASLAARVAALEDGTGGVGWIPIATAHESGSNFSIDLTAGGKFPDPPQWSMVRVHMRLDLTAAEFVSMRVNSDSSSIYRSGVVPIRSDAAFGAESTHLDGVSRWAIGRAATVSTNNLELLLFHTAGSNLLNFQCTSTRQSGSDVAHGFNLGWGSLTSGALNPSSLQFFCGASPASGEEFTDAWYWAEALRMEHPS